MPASSRLKHERRHTLLLLYNAQAILCSPTKTIWDASVAIDGNIILDIDSTEECTRRYPNARRLDCTGMALSSGLINTHNHTFGIYSRGLGKGMSTETWLNDVVIPINKTLTADDIYYATLLCCADSFRNGTTSVVEHTTNVIRKFVNVETTAMLKAGIRGAIARGLSTIPSGAAGDYCDPEYELTQTSAFLSRWGQDELVKPWVGPSGFFACDPNTMSQAKYLAREHNTKFTIHLNETYAQVRLAQRNGYSGQISWANDTGLLDQNTLVAHAVWVDQGELDMLKLSNAQIATCPTSNLVLGSGIAPVTRFLANNIPVAIGLDTPAANDSLDIFNELKTCVLLQCGNTNNPAAMSAKDGWTLATQNGAMALGLQNELGLLEPGYLADIIGVQLDGNPSLTPVNDLLNAFVYQSSGRDVSLTIVDGEIVYHNGEFKTIDIEEVIDYVGSISAALN